MDQAIVKLLLIALAIALALGVAVLAAVLFLNTDEPDAPQDRTLALVTDEGVCVALGGAWEAGDDPPCTPVRTPTTSGGP